MITFMLGLRLFGAVIINERKSICEAQYFFKCQLSLGMLKLLAVLKLLNVLGARFVDLSYFWANVRLSIYTPKFSR